jgi:hypothetical protein
MREETVLDMGIRGSGSHVNRRHFVSLVGENVRFEISYAKVF